MNHRYILSKKKKIVDTLSLFAMESIFFHMRKREREITVKMITGNFFDMYFIFLINKMVIGNIYHLIINISSIKYLKLCIQNKFMIK